MSFASHRCLRGFSGGTVGLPWAESVCQVAASRLEMAVGRYPVVVGDTCPVLGLMVVLPFVMMCLVSACLVLVPILDIGPGLLLVITGFWFLMLLTRKVRLVG